MKRYLQYPRWDNRRMSGTMWRTAKFVFRGSSQKSNPSSAVEQFESHVWLFAMARLCLCLGQPTWLSRWSAFLFCISLTSIEWKYCLLVYLSSLYISMADAFTYLPFSFTFLLPWASAVQKFIVKQWTSAHFTQLHISIVWSWIIFLERVTLTRSCSHGQDQTWLDFY